MFNFKRFFTYIWRVVTWHWPVPVLWALSAIAELQARSAGQACLPLDYGWLARVAVRDLILGLAVMLLLQFLLGDFVRAVYGLKTSGESQSFLRRRLFGTLTFKPYLIIKEGKLPDYKDPLMRIGGPGSLVIYKDSAVVLEQAGKLTRVMKRGFAKLDYLERVWDVVDLRPHHWVYGVSAMSKDGIPVTCQADVTFQIDDGGRPPSEEEPFPATEQAIFYAATRKLIRVADRSEDDQVFDWERRAIIGNTEGALRAILARYLLDQLLGPDEVNRAHHRSEIRSKLEAELRKSFPDIGAKLIKVELGDIKVDDKIAQQQIEAWRSLWQRWTREREAEGEAARLQAVEAAKAQAQADMIVAITQAFQSLTEAGAAIPAQLVLLRMFEVLKRVPYDPQTGMLFLPAEVLKTWKLVQDLALGQAALPEAKESE